MTPDTKDALEALQRRLEHVEATAKLLCRQPHDQTNLRVLEGIAATVEEMGDRLATILHAPPAA